MICIVTGADISYIFRNDSFKKWIIPVEDEFITVIKQGRKYSVIGNENIQICGAQKVDTLIFNTTLEMEVAGFYCSFSLWFTEVTKGFDHYQRIEIPTKRFTLGCHPSCDIQIQSFDPNMLLDFSPKKQKWLVRDCSAKFHLTINGISQQQGYLVEMDRIQFRHFNAIFCKDFILVNLLSNIPIDFKQFDVVTYNKLEYDHSVIIQAERLRSMKIVESKTFEIDSFERIMPLSERSIFYTIGPGITMAAASLAAALFSFLTGYAQGRKVIELLPTLLMPTVLILSGLIWPYCIQKNEKRKYMKSLQKRNQEYCEYLNEIEIKLNQNLEDLRKSKNDRYPENLNFSLNEQSNWLYQKTKEHTDFCCLALGYGTTLSKIELKLKQQESDWHDYSLLQRQNELIKKSTQLENSLIEYSLLNFQIHGFVLAENQKISLFKQVIQQLITMHSPQQIRCLLFVNDLDLKQLQVLRWCSHFFSDDEEIRLIVTKKEQIQTAIAAARKTSIHIRLICFVLHEALFYSAKSTIDQNKEIIQIHFQTDQKYLPANTQSLLFLRNQPQIQNVKSGEQQLFTSSLHYDVSLDKIVDLCRKVFFKSLTYQQKLPIGLLELFEATTIEQLDIHTSWQRNKSLHSLKAILGLDQDKVPIILDLDERAMGPHGLIAGCTGSGKSELILTLILSLSIQYSPKEVQFVMLDYKGGSSIVPLFNQDYQLPHLVGTITNQDGLEISRSLQALKYECSHRQRLFKQATQLAHHAVMNITDYQNSYHDYSSLPYLGHLILIIDEFAELKKEEPEYMNEIISIARVGRSLGIHLILATQKPSGIINDQIWSNTNFKICLRVQDKQDSREVIGTDEAANLTTSGSFYLVSAMDKIKGRSAYCHAYYKHKPTIFELKDTILSTVALRQETPSDQRKEIEVVVPYLMKVATTMKLLPEPCWLNRPESCLVSELITTDYESCSFLGVSDLVKKRSNQILIHEYKKNHHCLYLATTAEKRKQFLQIMIEGILRSSLPEKFILNLAYSRKEMNSENSSFFENKFSIFDSVNINKLFDKLQHELQSRLLDCKEKIPLYFFCDDLGMLLQVNENMKMKFNSFLQNCRDTQIYIVACISSPSAVSSSTLMLFDRKLSMISLSKADQFMFFGKADQLGANEEKNIGLIDLGELTEFTLARSDSLYLNSFSIEMDKNKFAVPVMPTHCSMIGLKQLAFGVYTQSCEPAYWSMKKPVLITGLFSEPLETFSENVKRMIAEDKFDQIPYIVFNLNEFIGEFDKNPNQMTKSLVHNKIVLVSKYSDYLNSRLRNMYMFEEIVWLGSGFQQQHLIPVSSSEFYQLEENEGVVSYNGKQRKIQCFDL